MSKIKPPHLRQSIIRETLAKKIQTSDLDDSRNFLLSFKHLDKSQGQSFSDWQHTGMLAEAIETLSNYCHLPLDSQVDRKKFTIYGSFPPKGKTTFTHPKHVPEDAKWARIHINGTHILAGHVFQNVFYLVFLDQEHEFYISEKKNT